MAFFKRVWWKVNVLSHTWAVGSTLPLIRPLKWGTLCLWTPAGSKMASRQSWKNEKNVRFSTKTDIFFRSFNFDGLCFWNHWEFRDVMYLIWKISSVVNWSQQLKGVTAHLPSTTPFWKRPFYREKGQIVCRVLSIAVCALWMNEIHKY